MRERRQAASAATSVVEKICLVMVRKRKSFDLIDREKAFVPTNGNEKNYSLVRKEGKNLVFERGISSAVGARYQTNSGHRCDHQIPSAQILRSLLWPL